MFLKITTEHEHFKSNKISVKIIKQSGFKMVWPESAHTISFNVWLKRLVWILIHMYMHKIINLYFVTEDDGQARH